MLVASRRSFRLERVENHVGDVRRIRKISVWIKFYFEIVTNIYSVHGHMSPRTFKSKAYRNHRFEDVWNRSRTSDKINKRNPGGIQSGFSGKSSFTGMQNSEFLPVSIDWQYFSLIMSSSSVDIRSVNSSRFRFFTLDWANWKRNITEINFIAFTSTWLW